VNVITGTIVFILLVLIFMVPTSLAVTRAGSRATLNEQVYSKQISTIIDKAKPGMEIKLEMFDAYALAGKNKVQGNIVSIDNNLNQVTVKLAKGNGYVSYYFNNVDVGWDLDKEKRLLILKIGESVDDGFVLEGDNGLE